MDPELVEAIERAADADEAAPQDREAWLELAQLYELAREPQKAEAALLRSIAISPRDPRMLWRLANLK